MEVRYTIVNICPKKTFTSEEELKKYCETHPVPDANFARYGKDKFVIEKTITEEFTLDGMTVDTSIDKTLCLDLIHNLADNFNQKHIDFSTHCTPFNSYYYSGENYKAMRNWIINFLKNTEAEHIKECLDVHTNFAPCNGFVIHIDKSNETLTSEYIKKYNKENGTNYKWSYQLPIRSQLIHKCCGGDVKPASVDFSTWTPEELEAYKVLIEPGHLYIQFRKDDIMVDSSYYTGRHVSHRQNNPIGFDKNRYDWCMERVKGNFKKHK